MSDWTMRKYWELFRNGIPKHFRQRENEKEGEEKTEL